MLRSPEKEKNPESPKTSVNTQNNATGSMDSNIQLRVEEKGNGSSSQRNDKSVSKKQAKAKSKKVHQAYFDSKHRTCIE